LLLEERRAVIVIAREHCAQVRVRTAAYVVYARHLDFNEANDFYQLELQLLKYKNIKIS
jgi:hypothetical protein